MIKSTKGKKKNYKYSPKSRKRKQKPKKNYNLILIITFFVGVLLIFCTYCWFFASLNVRLEFFNMIVSNESGLFISLDGVNFGGSVEISRESVITKLKSVYPNHNNQWATRGMYAVSSNGIPNSTTQYFNMFGSSRMGYKEGDDSKKKYLNTSIIDEEKANDDSAYIAFDLFLKNVSGSPKSDNLYLVEGTSVYFDEEDATDADGIINSIRFGFVKIGSTSSKSPVNTIQNLKCENNCQMFMFEPNSAIHSNDSIYRASKYGINIINGQTAPTYAVISEGELLDMPNGQPGYDTPLDTEHFALQHTLTGFSNPVCQIPNGVTKFRVYVWIEGQDIDSLESASDGAAISIAINFYKDLAGYEE